MFEKKIKNKKKKNATILNLNERAIKGLELSTITLLVINAEDQRKTKISGIILKILFSLIKKVKANYLTSSIGLFSSSHLLWPPFWLGVFKRPILLAMRVVRTELQCEAQ